MLEDTKFPITIGTGFYNSEWAFRNYTRHLEALDFDKRQIRLVWVDNGSTDKTPQMLDEWTKNHRDEYDSVELLHLEHVSQGPYQKLRNVASVVNLIMRRAVNDLVFIDHDNGGPPDSIHRLLRLRQLPNVGVAAGIMLLASTVPLELTDGHRVVGTTPMPFVAASMLDFDKEEKTNSFTLHRPFMPGLRYSFRVSSLQTPELGPCTLFIPSHLLDQVLDVDAVGKGFAIVAPEVYRGFQVPPDIAGDDVNICLHAKKLGKRVLADTGLIYPHFRLLYTSWRTSRGLFFKVYADISTGVSPTAWLKGRG